MQIQSRFWATWFLTLTVISSANTSVSFGAAAACKLGWQPSPHKASNCNDFWIIDSRRAPACQNLEAGIDRLTYLRRCENGQLSQSSALDFLTAEPMYTVVYIHGNGQTEQMAIKTGRILFRKLERCATVPFRFVVWSWHSKGPGARHGLSNRIRTHADWADAQGYYVANVVSRMSNAYPVNLMGFSLGSITASSALHYLGGGQIGGRTLPATPPVGYFDLRSVQLAGAMDNDLLLPGRRYDQALNAVSQILITINRQDRILRFWPKVSHRNQSAIGKTGIPGICMLGSNQAKVQYFTTTPYVGKTHSTYVSLRSDAICKRFAKLFFAPPHMGFAGTGTVAEFTPAGQSSAGLPALAVESTE